MKGLDFRDPIEGRKQNKEIAKSGTIILDVKTEAISIGNFPLDCS